MTGLMRSNSLTDQNGNRYPNYNDNGMEANKYMAKTFANITSITL